MNIVIKIALYISAAGLMSLLLLLFYRGKDRPLMMKFLRKLLVYVTPLTVIVTLFLADYYKMSKILNGISMSAQLDSSFSNVIKRPYRTIVLGNSRTYRGVNTDKIDSGTYNFSFDNETFFEQYFKLKYLEQQNALPELLILGVDYFEFSFLSMAMQPAYSIYFGDEYNSLISNLSSASGVEYGVAEETPDNWVNSKMSAVFNRGGSQYLNYLGRKIAGKPLQYPFLKENGQYIINPVPQAHDGEFMTRPSKVEFYQKEKFEQIMDFARKKEMRVVLLMPPCRDIELACYSDEFIKDMDTYFSSFEQPDSVWYLNMSNMDGYSTSDYMDETHLKPESADRFSSTLADSIRMLLQ